MVLAAATSLLLVPSGAATAKPPDPSTLPMGDPPAVTWQSGTTLHSASGKTISLPFGQAGNRGRHSHVRTTGPTFAGARRS